ncbi:MAG: hypothetical protein ABJA87_03685 [bacterium]
MSDPAGVGYGGEPSADDEMWQAAAEELLPAKALTRIGANARATVGTVSLVGTALGGLGLLSLPSLPATAAARPVAITAIAIALLAVLAGLVYLALRVERVNVQDLNQVQAWYAQQFRRTGLAVAASWLLVLAIVLAAVAAGLALLQGVPQSAATSQLGLRIVGAGTARSLQVDAIASGLPAGSVVTVRVTGLAGPACPQTVLIDGRSTTDATGRITVAAEVAAVGCARSFRLELLDAGSGSASLTVP